MPTTLNTFGKWISNAENLWWAWQKARNLYKHGDIWFDQIEVARFEANIETELSRISKEILNGYRITPIRPMASPKPAEQSGDSFSPRVRQTFWVSVKDQVAWLAVLNIIGPFLDKLMPHWSYGNRLYVPTFYEDQTLKFGRYRHTARHTYRKWNQSWPLYRKHIAVTARIMAKSQEYRKNPNTFLERELEQEQRDLVEQNRTLPHHLKVLYLESDYWNRTLSGKVYWGGIDFSKFYPSLKITLFPQNIKEHCPLLAQDPSLDDLINHFISFPVDYRGWGKDELAEIGLAAKPTVFQGVPTGLFAAGFIANVCLLDIDFRVQNYITQGKNVAHFRFVDDHVFLTDSFESLCNYLDFYDKLLDHEKTGLSINSSKTEPARLGQLLMNVPGSNTVSFCEWLNRLRSGNGQDSTERDCEIVRPDSVRKFLLEDAERDTELDPKFLSPLMTQTLAKVSGIARTDFELLDENEEDQLIADLEHLLLTDFPDQELRRDTRVSFAASMLSRFVPKRRYGTVDLYQVEEKVKELEQEKRDLKRSPSNKQRIDERIRELVVAIKKEKGKKKQIEKDLSRKKNSVLDHTFNLLLKAVQDNSSKVRLWVRLLEFCQRSGVTRLGEVLGLIELLHKQHKLHALASDFLRALVMQVLANLLTNAYRVLSDPDRYNHSEREAAVAFSFAVFKPALVNKLFPPMEIIPEAKFYLLSSRRLLRFSLVSILRLLSRSNLEFVRDRIGQLKKTSRELDRSQWDFATICDEYASLSETYPLGGWIWWAVRQTSNVLTTEPNLLWVESIGKLSPDNSVDLSVMTLYPAAIPNEVLLRMAESQSGQRVLKRNAGWVLDAVEARKEFFLSSALRATENTVARITSQPLPKSISLLDWARWGEQHNQTLHGAQFDPRLSEWTCLEITKQIAIMIRDGLDSSPEASSELLRFSRQEYYLKVHPANYIVPQSWTTAGTLSWDEWESYLRKSNVRKRSKSTFISDPRYTPTIKDSSDVPDEMGSVIYGLGVLLWGLLRRDFSMPPFTNPLGFARIWAGLYRRSLAELSVSSRTLALIMGCFSVKNRETRFLRRFQDGLFDQPPADDTVYDPPDIFTIDDFLQTLDKAQSILKRYRLTVQNHQPRQLIPVNLAQETRTFDPWEDVDNE